MRAFRLISLLIAVAGCAPLAHAGILDWLFHHEVDVTVNTDVTPAGAKLPTASSEHPIYYLGVSMGYRDLGGIIAGDKLPSEKAMDTWVAKALAKQGYLPWDAKHPPTEIVVFTWGTLYVNWFSGDIDFPRQQMNRGQMLQFLGGAKLGLVSRFPTFPDMELAPELTYLKPSAQRIRTASSDDLYMAALLGYDLQAAIHKKAVLLWRTRIACPSRGLVMADTLPKMITIAAPLIARETAVPEWIRASDVYKPVVKIGNPVVEEYLDSTPISFLDASNNRAGRSRESKK